MKLSRTSHACVVLLGAANLLPWMAFLSMADYFTDTYHSNQMEYSFPALSTAVLVATSTLVLTVGAQFSFDARILLPSVVMAGAMLAVPLIDLLLRARILTTSLAFSLTLTAVFFNAFSSSVAQNSLYGLAGVLGDGATQALQTGTGAMGVVSVLLRALTKAMPNVSSSGSMWVFCVSGSVILLISAGAYTAMGRDPSISSRLVAIEARRAAADADATALRAAAEQMLPADGKRMEEGGARGAPPPLSPVAKALGSLRDVWVECASVFTCFVVCLACFPGLSTSFVSRDWHIGSWFPLLMVAMYNVGDLVGKALPASVRLIELRTLPWWVLAHVTFLPLFLLLSQRQQLPGLLGCDLLPTVVVFALGVSTGYIGCMSLVLVAEHEGGTPEQKESWGMASSFSLMMGLTVGSGSSLIAASLVGST